MPLSSAQQVRQRIQDFPRPFDSAYYADGISTRYHIGTPNLVSGSAYVQPGGTAWSATGATFNSSGFVDFSDRISANSAYRVVGVYTVFADDVIDERISALNSINAVALEFAYDLLFDGGKRGRWMSPDGSQWDNVGSLTAINSIIRHLELEIEKEAIQGGGFWSWAETQSDY